MPTPIVGLHAAVAAIIAMLGLSFFADPCGGGGDLCLGGLVGLWAFGAAGIGVSALGVFALGVPAAILAGRAVARRRVERLVAIAGCLAVGLLGGVVSAVLIPSIGLLALAAGWATESRGAATVQGELGEAT